MQLFNKGFMELMEELDSLYEEDCSLTEDSMGGWLDAIDNVETEADVYDIPDWALRKAGVSRDSLLNRVRRSNVSSKPAPAELTTSTPATKDYTDEASAKQFWSYAKQNIIDYASFHKAYDQALANAGVDLWALFGNPITTLLTWTPAQLAKESLYTSIKWNTISKYDSSLASVRALRKLWSLEIKTGAKTLYQIGEENKSKFGRDVKHIVLNDPRAAVSSEKCSSIVSEVSRRDGYFHLYDDNVAWGDDQSDWPTYNRINLTPGVFNRTPEEVAEEILTKFADLDFIRDTWSGYEHVKTGKKLSHKEVF